MPNSTKTYFSSIFCWSVVNLALATAFLVIGAKHYKACCNKPLANWNIAAGAIGILVSLVTFASLLLSNNKANKYEPQESSEVTTGPDGRELTPAQQEAVTRALRENEISKARRAAMYEGPIGRLFAFLQSTQTCYVLVMVIIGASFVWSTEPSEDCDPASPQGCEPFLWNWTQAFVIIYFVFTGLLCCLGCCSVCALAAMVTSRSGSPSGEPPPSPGV